MITRLVSFLSPVALLVVVASLGCSTTEEPMSQLSVEGKQFVSRGQELVAGLAACGSCHSMGGRASEPLAGGRELVDLYGDVTGPNITLAKSGIAGWSERDVLTLLRSGKRPDGEMISPEVHRGYEWISDLDIAAIISYLRTLRPVEREIERREVSMIDRNTTGLFEVNKDVTGYVPAISPQYPVEYGQYLADHVARCGTCHNSPSGLISSEEYWAGGKTVTFGGEELTAPNISNSKVAGLGDWTEDELRVFFRSGRTRDGRRVNNTFCPVEYYQRAPDQDISALIAYIRTVPAVE